MAEYLTIAEVAERLALGESTIRDYVRTGHLPAIQIKGAIRIDWNDVLKFKQRGAGENEQREGSGVPRDGPG